MLRGMVSNTQGLAKELGTQPEKLNDAAKAAIELDKVIRRLEGEPEEEVEELALVRRP